MRDADVRTAVLATLREIHEGDPATRIVEEMGVWSGSVRIDVAVINGELHGFEFKSARDTLKRLPSQAEIYCEVFDRVTLVAADRHVEGVKQAIPSWWGITIASGEAGSVQLKEARGADLNPGVNAVQVARLLWRSEALAVLEKYELDRGVRSQTVERMVRRLAENLSTDTLAYEVRQALKDRAGWLG
jgi:hypothetical protein